MSHPTHTLIGPKARKAVLEGVNAIYEPVRRTLGPNPRKALIYRTYNRGSRIVDDGHTVAEVQEPKNIHIRLAAGAFKEGCKRTNEIVGDGTATTTVVAGKLFNDAYNLLNEGSSEFTKAKSGKISAFQLKKDILKTAAMVKEKIKESAIVIKTLKDLEKIAIVSVGDERVGKIVAKLAWDVGVDGFIDVVEGFKREIETEINNGFRFPAKPGAKAFVNNPTRFEMVATDCDVLVTNYALDNAMEVGLFMRKLNDHTSKIVVIAPSFSDSVLINMTTAVKQGFTIFPVAVPALRTERFEDLAIYCDAKFIDKSKGHNLRAIDYKNLGFIEKLIVKDTENREDAVATGGRGTVETSSDSFEEVEIEGKKKKVLNKKTTSPIKERIDVLKGQWVETQQEQFKKLLERRIASIASSVGVIRVGDSTQAAALDMKMKIEDAVYACKAALRGGYVKGGGLCLKEIADTLPDEDILKEALLAPYKEIQASVDGGVIIGPEIIDPMEAELYAVEHATGVVANLITVETLTPEIEEVSPGEGYTAIAQALTELVLSDKFHKGLIKENEMEMERDRMNGMTMDEKISVDNG